MKIFRYAITILSAFLFLVFLSQSFHETETEPTSIAASEFEVNGLSGEKSWVSLEGAGVFWPESYQQEDLLSDIVDFHLIPIVSREAAQRWNDTGHCPESLVVAKVSPLDFRDRFPNMLDGEFEVAWESIEIKTVPEKVTLGIGVEGKVKDIYGPQGADNMYLAEFDKEPISQSEVVGVCAFFGVLAVVGCFWIIRSRKAERGAFETISKEFTDAIAVGISRQFSDAIAEGAFQAFAEVDEELLDKSESGV